MEIPQTSATNYGDMQEVIDDLSTRFIINIPREELSTIERIFFQIEEAHWFYEDFIVEQNPNLQSMSLKNFAAIMLQQNPALNQLRLNPSEVYQSFLNYKFKVPACGSIIFNESMNK
ncbi:mRNA decapping complex subunit 2, partial [Zancudomyces culisetae]